MSQRPVIAIDFGGVLSIHDRGPAMNILRQTLICPGVKKRLKNYL
jgi:hypothetical protein